METLVNSEDTQFGNLPPEFKNLHDAIYKKVSGLIKGQNVDLRTDPTTIRIIFESTMEIVEKATSAENGKMYSGPEKRRIAITLIKTVIYDLAKNKEISNEVAIELNKNMDFWGGIVIDVAVSAGNHLFEIGQEFAKDTREKGCKQACKENCCCCCIS